MFFNCTKDAQVLTVDRNPTLIELRSGSGEGNYQRLTVLGASGDSLLVYDCHGHHQLVYHQRPRTMLHHDFEELSKWRVVDLGYGDGTFAIANLGPLDDAAGMCLLYFDCNRQTFAVRNMEESLHDDPAVCCRFRFHPA